MKAVRSTYIVERTYGEVVTQRHQVTVRAQGATEEVARLLQLSYVAHHLQRHAGHPHTVTAERTPGTTHTLHRHRRLTDGNHYYYHYFYYYYTARLSRGMRVATMH